MLASKTLKAKSAPVKPSFDESIVHAARSGASGGWLSILQKIGNIGIFDWDLKTDLATYSEQYKLIHGLDAGVESESFAQWQERLHPEDKARVVPHMRNFLGAPPEIDYRIIRPTDGEVRWITERREIVCDESGAPVRVIGLQRDTTAERNAVLALSDSERRLSIAVNAANIGIWEWDIGADRMIYSRIARDISGLDPEKPLRFEDVARIVHPEDYTRTSAMLVRALDPMMRENLPYEYRIVLPDGSMRWVLAHGEAIFETRDGRTIATRYLGTIQDVTARRRSAEVEKENLQRLRLALDSGRMAVWEVDLLTDTLTGSPELNRVLGFPEGVELSREDIRNGYLEGERERVQAIGRAAVEAGERFFEAEFRYRPPHGELRWLLLRCEVVKDSERRPVRAVGVVVDVTARKSAEEALGETTSTLNASIENAPIGFAFFDRDRRYVRVNEALAKFNGAPAAAHIGRRLAEIAPQIAAPLSSQLDRVFESGRSIDACEVRDDPGLGSRSWLTSFFPVLGSSGEVKYVGETRIDITDRKRAEARVLELNESLERRVAEALAEKRRLADVIDRTDIFVQVADLDLNWLAINQSASAEFARIFGVPRPKVGDNMLKALESLPEHQAAVKAVWERAIAGEEFVETQAFGEAALDRRYYEMRFRALRSADGKVAGAYQFVTDVTERVREQERLSEAEAALRQAQKMDAIGRLSGGIAHDFNNLLQGLVGSLDLIRRKPNDSARVARWAEAGLRAAERGAKLTGQLLAFSRAQKIETRPLQVTELVVGMKDLLQRTLGPSISVVFDLEETCSPVLADATQLEMAVLNLAINARDAMPDGGALTIFVRQRQLEGGDGELEPGAYVELGVGDTGTGMPPEVTARAFDPFFTTKGVGQGTGLGLSQVYGIARQAGGAARIESRLGRGTTVRLFLPCTNEPMSPSPALQPTSFATTASARILVVDDDPDARQFLADALESSGYLVDAVQDGYSALEALGLTDPDLMLLDFAMPGMTGVEVFHAARKRWPDLPIVLISGYAETAEIEKVVGAGISFLHKPFGLDELLGAVVKAIRTSSIGD